LWRDGGKIQLPSIRVDALGMEYYQNRLVLVHPSSMQFGGHN